MKEIILTLPQFFGGLFIGCLGIFMIYLSWSLITTGLQKAFSEASALFFIAGIFLFAIAYFIKIATFDWPSFIGATISVIFIGKSLLKAND